MAQRGDLHIRLPAEVRDRIRVLAEQNRRSVSQEVVVAVERHLEVMARLGHTEAPTPYWTQPLEKK